MSESSESLKRTPLYEAHKALGGKIVPFAGWELPVQYSGVIAEHAAVRERAGLFDVSHMGEIVVTGTQAQAALQSMTCNDLGALTDGKALYSAIINEKGGVVDDIIIYRYTSERFFLCVNASNTDKDFDWFIKHNKFQDAEFLDRSKEIGQIALQGPKSQAILQKVPGGEKVGDLKYFHFVEATIVGVKVIVARTGYTGEDGFEIFIPIAQTEKVWNALLEHGKAEGLIPCGLGARDSLRLEACYPLHGHELSDEISAIESGLGWIVKPDAGEFIGRPILVEQKKNGAPRSLVGIFLDDPGISRQGDKVFQEGKEIGVVTSGTKTPTVNRALALALIESGAKAEGTKLEVEVRGKRLAAHIVKRPFYSRAK